MQMKPKTNDNLKNYCFTITVSISIRLDYIRLSKLSLFLKNYERPKVRTDDCFMKKLVPHSPSPPGPLKFVESVCELPYIYHSYVFATHDS